MTGKVISNPNDRLSAPDGNLGAEKERAVDLAGTGRPDDILKIRLNLDAVTHHELVVQLDDGLVVVFGFTFRPARLVKFVAVR